MVKEEELEDLVLSEDIIDADSESVIGRRYDALTVDMIGRAKLAGYKRIRSSDGDVENSPYIKTELLMDGITKNIELTLADRASMDYTMLIGRKALGRRWVVNPSIGFLTKPSGEDV